MWNKFVIKTSIIQKYVNIVFDVICNIFFDKYISTPFKEPQFKIIH